MTSNITHVNNWPNAAGFDDLEDTKFPVELHVTGTIPSYIFGTLLRTGPGSYKVPAESNGKAFKVTHWFDGFSQHHKFNISPPSAEFPRGRVTYRSRSGADLLKKRIAKHGGSPDVGSFNYQDPCKTKFSKFFTKYHQSTLPGESNIGVTINPYFPKPMSDESDLVTKTDANVLSKLNKDTLEVEEVFTWSKFHKQLDGPLSAAHSCFDNGEEFNYVLKFGKTPLYTVFGLDRSLNMKIYARIPVERASYVHSFFLTKKYIILAVWQAYYTFNGFSFLWNQNILDCINSKWDPKKKTKWYLVPRDGSASENHSKVKMFESDPFFSFHSINSWDDGDNVFVDLAQFDNHSILWQFTVEKLRSDTASRPLPLDIAGGYVRWKLPNVSKTSWKNPGAAVVDGRVRNKQNNIELPVMNNTMSLRPERYVYGVNFTGVSSFFERLIKLDVRSFETTTWFEEGCTPSEPIFVSNPNGTEEDDGVLLSVVLDGYKNRSMLVILDAKTFKEVARAGLPEKKIVGFGFHGSFAKTIN
ncbi:carotenoid oxygenase [Lipomyces japonicus]|uniref:carotenoid oxygenase n=1 Tax=Lipomyces japonicus TaxID=56871 RepID=UPI0034CD51CB